MHVHILVELSQIVTFMDPISTVEVAILVALLLSLVDGFWDPAVGVLFIVAIKEFVLLEAVCWKEICMEDTILDVIG